MPDIDKIIEQLLNDRHLSESATFSTRSYADQPLIEKGSDLKARMERRAQQRAERHEREARERRGRTQAPGNAGQQSSQSGLGSSTNRSLQGQSGNTTPHKSSWSAVDGSGAAGLERAHTEQPQTAGSMSFDDLLQEIRAQGQRLQGQGQAERAPRFPRSRELPKPIQEMRALEGAGVPRTLAYGSSSSAGLFYRQARMMEDFEDDHPYRGYFMQYYPTYAAMTDAQLRGYFTWRAQVRAGRVEAAPLSFAFVYAYELLMGIGTTPGRQGLADLRTFGEAYQATDELQGMRLNNYLREWLVDYAIYHDIPEAYQRKATVDQDNAIVTLYRAEHAYLKQHKREPRIPHPATEGPAPTDEQVFQALGTAATHHLTTSRLAKAEPELVQAVALDVFYALVMHCSKRRKTDYVEGLFGYASRYRFTMFSAAVFYESEPHPDCLIRTSDAELYECKDGQWWHTLAYESRSSSSELGAAMHAVDYELREQLHYTYPLKRRQAPKYLWKMVQDAVAQRLAERAEAEARRISIDLSKLDGIRAAAAVTQEALLTDEERGVEPAVLQPAGVVEQGSLKPKPSAPTVNDESTGIGSNLSKEALLTDEERGMEPAVLQPELAAPVADEESVDIDINLNKLDGIREAAAVTQEALLTGEERTDDQPTLQPAGVSEQAPPPPVAPAANGLLTAEEARLLAGLLDGRPASELSGQLTQFLSVAADSINEKLFDLVGDAVIEFDGVEPCIVEDYLEDVREVLSS